MKYDFKIMNLVDEHAYHNTAIFIYLKAVNDVLGDVNAGVRIGNSLNQGYFSTIKKVEGELTPSEIHKIDSRMKALIEHDVPITVKTITNAEAIKKWNARGFIYKARLLEDRDPDETIEIAECEGYIDCMYSKMLPSAGYIDKYEIRPYRKGLLLRLPRVQTPDAIPAYRDDEKIYDAYAASKRMRNATGIKYLADLNKLIKEGKSDEVIRKSEEHQSTEIKEFANLIVKEGKRIVLIAGPSSSGKTTTAKRICEEIAKVSEEPLYLGTDDYFVNRTDTPLDADGKPDFEGLNALDLELFNKQMEDLLSGKEVDIPEFDFIEGKKIFGKRKTALKEGQTIVIEGIHSLNDVLTQRIDPSWKFKIYISPLTHMGIDRHNRISTADARLLRRIVRDNQFRGYNAEATIDAWPKVRAGECVNIFPYSSSADVVFNSSTVYETNLLRGYAEPLLKAITEDSPHYEEAQRILGFMKYFDIIESADAVPQNSILREFIGHQ